MRNRTTIFIFFLLTAILVAAVVQLFFLAR